mgnify:CR=1 FL=1
MTQLLCTGWPLVQVLGRVQASSLYQTAATRLYPVVQPYADPAYAKGEWSHWWHDTARP